ncbi:hypothetical protein [Mucilaginibacter sp.]|uniref:hypothetical protein n=1 Tax=Mucilaginibacter sp. TaxID=1882438 RepID=UPI0025D82242|nr:hypothetical protein [Mucilaginibacter sp.]
MNEFKVTGSALIGRNRTGWPFASLTVSSNKLQLNASLFGNFVFAPGDVFSIVPDNSGLLIGKGIRIYHRVGGYNQKIVFISLENPLALINRIEQAGFLSNKTPMYTSEKEEIIATQTSGAFPVKIPATIVIVIIWNLCLIPGIFNMLHNKNDMHLFVPNVQLATGFIFLIAVTLLISESFGRVILKPGRTVNDVKSMIYFLMFISIFLFLGFTFIPR